jgi:hypothetical protein
MKKESLQKIEELNKKIEKYYSKASPRYSFEEQLYEINESLFENSRVTRSQINELTIRADRALEEEKDTDEIDYIIYRVCKILTDIERAEKWHYESIHEEVTGIASDFITKFKLIGEE